jgi:hypothetical protein
MQLILLDWHAMDLNGNHRYCFWKTRVLCSLPVVMFRYPLMDLTWNQELYLTWNQMVDLPKHQLVNPQEKVESAVEEKAAKERNLAKVAIVVRDKLEHELSSVWQTLSNLFILHCRILCTMIWHNK